MLNNLEEILKEFGERVTKLAKINIGATRTVKDYKGRPRKRRIEFTGKLRKSLNYKVDVFTNSIGFYIEMEDYGKDIDQGKKAGGMPDSIPKLETWIKNKPVRLRTAQGQFIKQTPSMVKSFAESIAYKHQKYGTQPTNFLTEPFTREFKNLPEEMLEAFGLDVESFLDQQFK